MRRRMRPRLSGLRVGLMNLLINLISYPGTKEIENDVEWMRMGI